MLRIKKALISLLILLTVASGAALVRPLAVRADEDVHKEDVSWDIDINDPGKVTTPDVDYENLSYEDRLVLEFRKHLKNFDEEFSLQITEPLDSSVSYYNIATYLKDKAVAHTGIAGEGDFLYYNLTHVGASVNLNTGTVTFYAGYRMTKSQLDELTKKEDKILKSLNIEKLNNYQKIRAIYGYLTKHVKYDYSKNKNPIVYTPYGALINNKAVCQGYAVAAYNLMLKAGIDCRVITGDNHAWNIVKLEGKYYYIDSTWDYGKAESKWTWFLKGTPFRKHTAASSFKTDEFKKKYPISTSNYKGNGKNSGNSSPLPTPTNLPTPTPTEPPLPDPVSYTCRAPEEDFAITVVAGDSVWMRMTGNNSMGYCESSDEEVFCSDPQASEMLFALKAGHATVKIHYYNYDDNCSKEIFCDVTVLYRDVTNKGDFWYAPTNALTAKGVVKGYDNQTTFKPSKNCTRAQMVTFIWRLQGEPEPESSTCKFSDVKKSDYFYKACIWGNENHIVEGYGNGTFGPQIVCARKHAVTFLWRLAGQPEPKSTENKFKDVKEKDYFYYATLWASEKGILAGYNDGTFRPNGDCLRRQMVTFLYKYDKKINSK